MPAQMDGANGTGIGMHAPTEKYGVMSPFHAGGGGAGGGGGAAATQLLDGWSKTVPHPHSTALLTPGIAIVANAHGASTAAPTIATRRNVFTIEGLPRSRSPTSNTSNPSPVAAEKEMSFDVHENSDF